MKRSKLLPFFFVVVVVVFSCASGGSVDVGVILDTKTWTGNISWSCMLTALDDFYAAYPNYSTKIDLHLRDTNHRDNVGAATAALDLLKNVQVQAIIGPQASAQAKFIIELGQKTRVPIISFSARSLSLSPQRSPYFVRATSNESSQTQVVASIVEAFKWREVVPVFDDDEYGNGIVPSLIDALREVGASVSHRSPLPLESTKDQIMEELHKLKNMRTRVFVVHMSYDSGFRLFSCAKEAGMMGEGYVWITTYGLIDLVDLKGASAANVMQGVLAVRPYVRETKKLENFKSRRRNRFQQEPTVFGLWAYDTVWSLALAVESAKTTSSIIQLQNATDNSTDLASLTPSVTGADLLNRILSTSFPGMAGKFRLVNGQLESNVFEILNVVENGKRIIGYWSPEQNISGNLDSKTELKGITWPGGGKEAVPKGWEWPISGKNLTIGIPVKPGFGGFVRFENGSAKGYCIEVFDAVMKEMPYAVPYDYVAYEDSNGEMNGTYDDLVYQVYLKKFDAVVGDVTIIANRSLYVDFTLPYTESGVSMLVPIIEKRRKNGWTFLDPLTADLWLSSGAFFVFTGFVVWVLEHRINEEFRGTPSNQLGTVFYFTFSTLIFAHREKIVSNLARVVMIIWLFVVLILQSSYTASLTSILTVEQLQPAVTDINELVKNGYSVGYLDDSFMPALLKRLGFNESQMKAYTSPEEYQQALSNGTVAAIVDEIPYIKVFLSKYCNKFTTTGPTYKTDGYGFVFPKGSPLVQDISRAILKVTEAEGKMTQIEKKLYGDGCSLEQGDGSATSRSLTVKSFSGLFLITGIASFSAIVLYLVLFLRKHRHMLKTDDIGNSTCQKLAALAKVYDQMEPSHAPKNPEENNEDPVMDDCMSPIYIVSGQESPSIISNCDNEGFELEEFGTTLDVQASPGRDISRGYIISGRESPSIILNCDNEGFELEEFGTTLDVQASPGRDISRGSPDPPSFADMSTERG